jgi:hypothetical protein
VLPAQTPHFDQGIHPDPGEKRSTKQVKIMSENRAGEHGSVPKRSGRFLEKDGYWYYTTREGVDIGPFDSREDAEIGVGEFIDFICAAEPKVKEALESYRAA